MIRSAAEDVLLVDMGNSRTKWAVCGNEDAFGTPFRMTGVIDNTELPAFAPASWRTCRRALVASVASSAMTASMEALLQALSIPVYRPQAEASAGGLINGYADPKQLGVDRWLAAIAAWRHFRSTCAVVSAGTALTVDAIAGSGDGEPGRFLGGFIVPGLQLMQRSLRHGAAGIHAINGLERAFPDNTGDAMYSGAIAAMTGAVHHMLRQLERRENTLPRCILSGGDAPLLAQALATRDDVHVEMCVVDNLVLQGLQLIESECS